MPLGQPVEREGDREVTVWLTIGVAAEFTTGAAGVASWGSCRVND